MVHLPILDMLLSDGNEIKFKDLLRLWVFYIIVAFKVVKHDVEKH
jgi:hypothetical protein